MAFPAIESVERIADFMMHHYPISSWKGMEYTRNSMTTKAGKNPLSTALTPLFRGQMVHRREVQCPGMMLEVMRMK